MSLCMLAPLMILLFFFFFEKELPMCFHYLLFTVVRYCCI